MSAERTTSKRRDPARREPDLVPPKPTRRTTTRTARTSERRETERRETRRETERRETERRETERRETERRSERGLHASSRDAHASSSRADADVAPSVTAIALPKLRLQLVLRRHAHWEGSPVAVVADEGPEAPLLELDRVALRRGLRPGLRQGVARSLVPDLRTAVVREAELEALESELVRGLQAFSPRIEPVPDEVGAAFFADPRGLERLFGGLDVWASSVHRYLRARRLRASVVCGHHPWLALALARTGHGARVIASPEQERTEAEALSLRSLGFTEKLCEPLEMLGIETLGGFLAIPGGELCTRFGRDAAELHRRHGERGQLPLQPVGIELPRRVQLELDEPTTELETLLFVAKSGLDPLLAELSERGERPQALLVELHLESHAPPGPFGTPARTLTEEERTWVERLEPAEPTADPKVWLELLRLRFGALELPASVLELALEAEPTPTIGHQLQTPTERPKRDVLAAARALARVRATFGDGSVTKATLHEAHLPEARFRWEPLRVLPVPQLRPEATHDVLPSTAFSSPTAFPALASSVGAASREASPASTSEGSSASSLARSSVARSSSLTMPLFAPSDPSDAPRPEGGVCAGSSPGLHSVLPPEHTVCSGGGTKEVRGAEVIDFGTARTRIDGSSTSAGSAADGSSTSAGSAADGSPVLEAPPRDRLQRRLLARPRPISVDEEGRPRPMGEHTARLFGPHRTSGGWWGRAHEGHVVERDYYYAETDGGALYWVFFDRTRSAWFLQGYVD
jgi:protein ImuB